MQTAVEILHFAEKRGEWFDEFAFQVLFSQLHKRLKGEAQGEDRRVISRICEKMEDRISSFKQGRTLSSIMYGLCKLDVDPSNRFLKLWSEQCVAVIGTLNSQDLSNAAYALAKL